MVILHMDRTNARRGLGVGLGLAVGTTAVAGAVLVIGASLVQWLGIASLVLLGDGVLLAILAYRGPRTPRTRVWPPAAHDQYVYEEGWRERPGAGRLSRRWLRMALPPLVLGVILFVVSASV